MTTVVAAAEAAEYAAAEAGAVVEATEATEPAAGAADAAEVTLAKAAEMAVAAEVLSQPLSDAEIASANAQAANALLRGEPDGRIDWGRLSQLLEYVLMGRQLVVVITCTEPDDDRQLPPLLLGRFVGSVANAYVHSQVLGAPPKGGVHVVLQGWSRPRISAEWSDDEPDEYQPARLS